MHDSIRCKHEKEIYPQGRAEAEKILTEVVDMHLHPLRVYGASRCQWHPIGADETQLGLVVTSSQVLTEI